MSEATKTIREAAVVPHLGGKIVDERWRLVADAIDSVEENGRALAARVSALERRPYSSGRGVGIDKIIIDDITPASPATPAFQVGDRVRANNDDTLGTVRCVMSGRLDVFFDDGSRGGLMDPSAFTLVSRPAPAADADLVERLLRPAWEAAFEARKKRAPWETNGVTWGGQREETKVSYRSVIRSVLSKLRAESRLCDPGELGNLKSAVDKWTEAYAVAEKYRAENKSRAERAEADLAETKREWESCCDRERANFEELKTLRDQLAAERKAHEETRAALDVEKRTRVMTRGGTPLVRTVYATTEERNEAILKMGREWGAIFAERNALRAELDALKAKRARKVTVRKPTQMDASELFKLDHDEDGFVANDEIGMFRSLRALGFRRLVTPESKK